MNSHRSFSVILLAFEKKVLRACKPWISTPLWGGEWIGEVKCHKAVLVLSSHGGQTCGRLAADVRQEKGALEKLLRNPKYCGSPECWENMVRKETEKWKGEAMLFCRIQNRQSCGQPHVSGWRWKHRTRSGDSGQEKLSISLMHYLFSLTYGEPAFLRVVPWRGDWPGKPGRLGLHPSQTFYSLD